MSFKLACAQTAPKKADLQANISDILSIAKQASDASVDLLVFPEASTSGYFLEGGVLESSMTSADLLEALRPLASTISRPLDLLLGFYERSEANLYNSAAYLTFANGAVELVHVYRKFFLATYGVFDESRFVGRGRDLGVIDTRFGRIGILICEDVWHSVMPSIAAAAGAQLLLIPSASPGRGFTGPEPASLARYRRILVAASEEHGVWSVNCQLCGFEGGKGLIGGSSVVDPFGTIVAESPILDPHLLVATIDLDSAAVARARSPLISDLESAWGDVKRLVEQAEARRG